MFRQFSARNVVVGRNAMTSLSLREAAEQAGTSKSTIWRAIKSGRLSATRTDDGGFAIDPAELFRAFPPERPSERVAGQDATPHEIASERPATLVTDSRTDELAVKLAASEAELSGLKALLAEVNANRDELRQDRDEWRGRAERLLAGPQRQPWWRRLVG
jgi:excisionase family DNA binding protein